MKLFSNIVENEVTEAQFRQYIAENKNPDDKLTLRQHSYDVESVNYLIDNDFLNMAMDAKDELILYLEHCVESEKERVKQLKKKLIDAGIE